ncbi:TetR-like C-terminal domain-containing protein [Actinoplanes sp. CA-054009]
MTATFTLGREPRVIDVLRALMAEAQINPAFGDRFRTAFLHRRRAALGAIVDRARARGDLPSAPTPGTIADIVFGVVWYRLLATGKPLDQGLADDLVTTLTGSAPDPGEPG